MSDHYSEFVQSTVGKTVAKNLGLPLPAVLERQKDGKADVRGDILFGTAKGDSSVLAKSAISTLAEFGVDLYVNSSDEVDSVIDLKVDNDTSKKFKVVVFDASNISNGQELKQIYDFFHPIARRIEKSGRVIILGRPPEEIDSIAKSMAQRSLEGFIKSVGKEFKNGIMAQVIYVSEGQEKNLASTLRFFASVRSAYVSGQVVRVGAGKAISVDWAKPLANKTILVTGASRGIGEAIARVLSKQGAHVICLDIPPQQADLQKVAGEITGSTLALDITAEDAGEQIKAAAEKHGGLDGIVHNAGVTRDKTLAKMDDKRWDMVMNINLISIANVNKYLIENNVLNSDARIVCVSSISGIAGNLGQTNYSTSKAGVIGLVQATAKQLAELSDGITINAVAPGFIETQMTAQIPFAIREAGRRMNSVNQGGLPVDVAETIAWFSSPASGGVNGNIVRVCGQSLLGA